MVDRIRTALPPQALSRARPGWGGLANLFDDVYNRLEREVAAAPLAT